MKNDDSKLAALFAKDYMKSYSDRDLGVIPYIHEDFMGLDGISVTIYNQTTWTAAIAHDYKEMPDPFRITITDCESRKMSNGHVMVTLISLWYIDLFENAPEFDKMRTVFILVPTGKSFKVIHQSNSLSLLPFNKDDVYPTELLKFLKLYKKSSFGNFK